MYVLAVKSYLGDLSVCIQIQGIYVLNIIDIELQHVKSTIYYF